jgi:hypothetical protein
MLPLRLQRNPRSSPVSKRRRTAKMARTSANEDDQLMSETCQNPFFKCESIDPTKIAVSIHVKGVEYLICHDCWNKIAESDDYEWETERTRNLRLQQDKNMDKQPKLRKISMA